MLGYNTAERAPPKPTSCTVKRFVLFVSFLLFNCMFLRHFVSQRHIFRKYAHCFVVSKYKIAHYLNVLCALVCFLNGGSYLCFWIGLSCSISLIFWRRIRVKGLPTNNYSGERKDFAVFCGVFSRNVRLIVGIRRYGSCMSSTFRSDFPTL